MLVRHTGGLVAFEVADDSALALTILRRDLVASFQARHADHPQYADWCDGAVLVRVLRMASYKGGTRLERGDIMLARWDEGWPEADLAPHWTAYDPTTGHNVAVAAGKAEVVA